MKSINEENKLLHFEVFEPVNENGYWTQRLEISVKDKSMTEGFCERGRDFHETTIVMKIPTKERNSQVEKITPEIQVLAFLVKSMHVWQLQSEKRQISQPKQTHEVQPLHVGERMHPL